ncbi:hypothetical protein GBW32_28005 [Streptomyces tsukubensis]|uniref:Uncharacterized protein n=2 Tax=Streptomyces tsukubensis TaxID=83656 RepID=A0A1V4AAL8_9ACTN|nr:hypothetical protein B1H18_11530 [Streptomyces tsukubensis]QFR98069.1 hypothetical protein GBW32_28005 [Streptomyces tsukubensis]
MHEWALGATGRIVTWPAPDAYVLVEGVLLRMRPDIPGTPPGTEVVVGHDAERRSLVAHSPVADSPTVGSADSPVAGRAVPGNEDGRGAGG